MIDPLTRNGPVTRSPLHITTQNFTRKLDIKPKRVWEHNPKSQVLRLRKLNITSIPAIVIDSLGSKILFIIGLNSWRPRWAAQLCQTWKLILLQNDGLNF